MAAAVRTCSTAGDLSTLCLRRELATNLSRACHCVNAILKAATSDAAHAIGYKDVPIGTSS